VCDLYERIYLPYLLAVLMVYRRFLVRKVYQDLLLLGIALNQELQNQVNLYASVL